MQMEFSKVLLNWYQENKRDLPWRRTTDPYKIWLSEIILQQTRVDQGLPYYLKFTQTFPTIFDLASASEDQVLKLWQGLGYYSRARNLHETAKRIVNEFNGVFPNSFEDIKSLKGVGDYTASAIASISFGLPHAVVDGNVYRVLSRVFGIYEPINTTSGIKIFKSLAQELLAKNDPANFNQAIMEFGARHCKPNQPFCDNCGFKESCVARIKNEVSIVPVKIKKAKVKKRYFNYLVVVDNANKTLIQQRLDKGIWQKLFEFPIIETQHIASEDEILRSSLLQELFSDSKELKFYKFNSEPVIHKLSHQHLHTTFWIFETAKNHICNTHISNLGAFAFPVLIQDFIDKFSFNQVII